LHGRAARVSVCSVDERELSPATTSWLDSGRRIEVEGKRIFVYERGDGPALLLLHGFPTSCYDWRGVIGELSSDCRCIALDFPGFGLSDKPANCSYSLFQQADVVEGVARALGIERCDVVSHDMGTSVHCELLARNNESGLSFEIASSTFLNGSMLQWLATITPFQELLASNKTLQQAIDLCNTGLEGYVGGLKAIMKRPECVSDDDALVMQELLNYQDGHRRLPATSGYMRERYVNADRWLGALGASTTPLQFVWADGDPIANIEMGRELHRLYPDAGYTELAGLGHFLLIEDPKAVADAVRGFVKR
jgi:pimeloyl-ACP methyl ester carboxylesterase